MANIISSMPIELEHSLQYLAEKNENKTKTTSDEEELKKIGEKILVQIDNSIPTLNVSTQLYLNRISEFIKDGIDKAENWNSLPHLSQIRRDINMLKDISNFISNNINSISIDIFSLMAEILKFQREASSKQADQRLASKVAQKALNDLEKTTREKASNQQFTADMISGVARAASGILQAAFSIKGGLEAKANLNDAFSAKAKTLELGKHNVKYADTKIKLDDATDTLNSLKLQKKNISVGETKNLDIKIQHAMNKKEILKKNYAPYKMREEQLKTEIATLNDGIRASAERTSAYSQIGNSTGAVINAAADCIGAGFKSASRLGEIDADFISKRTGFINSSEQGHQEALRNIQELMKDFIQRIQNIIQTMDSTTANIVSKL